MSNEMEDIIQEFAKAVFERKEMKIVIPDRISMVATDKEIKIMQLLRDIALLRQVLPITYENPMTNEIEISIKVPEIRKENNIHDGSPS